MAIAGRFRSVVTQDIRDAKRLRTLFEIMKGFGEHWQYSIFFCVLAPIDRVRIQVELEEVLNLHEGQALIIDLGENDLAARAAAIAIGQSKPETLKGTVTL